VLSVAAIGNLGVGLRPGRDRAARAAPLSIAAGPRNDNGYSSKPARPGAADPAGFSGRAGPAGRVAAGGAEV